MTMCKLTITAIGIFVSAIASTTSGQPCEFEWKPGGALAQLNNTVTALTTWDPDGAGPKEELLIAGGTFTTVGGITANGVAGWDGAAWRAFGAGVIIPGSAPWPEFVYDATVFQGNLIVGGDFDASSQGRPQYLAQWNGATWQSVGTGIAGQVNSFAVHNGSLYVAGGFSSAGGTIARHVARWNGSTWQALGTGTDNFVSALAVFNDELIAAGSFGHAGGILASNIARWNGTIWLPLGAGTNGWISSLVVYDGKLIAAGDFDLAGGGPAKNIAQWNGVNWTALGSGIHGESGYPFVWRLSTYGPWLVAGGPFSQAGDSTAMAIARWDGLLWLPVGTGLSAASGAPAAYAAGVYRGELIAGGWFASAGAQNSPYIARWGPSCDKGDLDCNGRVTPIDVLPFAAALLEPLNPSSCVHFVADINQDYVVNGDDIESFVRILTGD